MIKRQKENVHLKYSKRVVPNVFAVALAQVVEANQEGVVHDAAATQPLHVFLELVKEDAGGLWAELKLARALEPVEVLEHGPALALWRSGVVVEAANGGALEVVDLMDVLVGREDVSHNDKVDFAALRKLDAVEAEDTAEEGVWVCEDVGVVCREDLEQHAVLRGVDGLYDEAVVGGVVEEAAALAGRPKLRKDILAGQRQQVVVAVDLEQVPEPAEHPRRVVLELEVVL